MPSIDIDVTSVPDIIEAQLTLSYSRLTDLIRVIVDQGNGHEDDIDEIRDRLAKLVQENSKLRSEIETLKQNQGPGSNVAAELDELRASLKQLNDKADANTSQIAAVTAAQSALAESVEKQAEERQAKLQATVAEHAASVDRRIGATEKSAQVAQAFIDLWGAVPEQVLEMGRRNKNQEVEHSLKDRTTYLLSMSAFVKVREELEVMRALMQRQAADALAAKTSEVARTSRTASLVVPQHDSRDNSAELEELAKSVRTAELQLQVMAQQRLPSLETAVRELQGRHNGAAQASNTEKDVDRLYEQLALLEDRLNTLLGLSKKESKENGGDAAAAANPALVDLARRVSMLEGTVEGLPRGSTPTSADASTGASGNGGGGEVVSADGARPSSSSASRNPQGRPPSGRPASAGVLPHLTRDAVSGISSSNGGSYGGAGSSATPPPRRASSLLRYRQGSASEAAQPTVDALRRQETSQPAVAAGGRRISVAVEPDEGLRRRVAQLEENTAILEVNKADRKELQQLEAALRHALSNMNRPHSATTQSSPSLIPQRPISAGSRAAPNQASSPLTDFAQAQRADGFGRPASASGAMGRPMFVGSSSSVFLRDGAQLTNASVSSTNDNRL